MNTNPTAKRILCFGDSNTWGQIPGGGGRYEVDKRWPGILQKLLAEKYAADLEASKFSNIFLRMYEIIEEGLPGRTTAFDDIQLGREGRNGKTYFYPCVLTHNPLDAIIIFLGTNDLKQRYQKATVEIANGLEELIKIVRKESYTKDNKQPEIIILSPPIIKESVDKSGKFTGSQSKSENLGTEFKKIALKYKCKFLDLAKVVQSSDIDGFHLDAASHQKIADELYKIVINIF
jgi:lysophospholipase L1-like esterase